VARSAAILAESIDAKRGTRFGTDPKRPHRDRHTFFPLPRSFSPLDGIISSIWTAKGSPLVASLDREPFRARQSSAGYTASANRICADERYRKTAARKSSCGPRAFAAANRERQLGPGRNPPSGCSTSATACHRSGIHSGNQPGHFVHLHPGGLHLACEFCSTGRQDSTAISRCPNPRAALACQPGAPARRPGVKRVHQQRRVMGMGEPLLNFDTPSRR